MNRYEGAAYRAQMKEFEAQSYVKFTEFQATQPRIVDLAQKAFEKWCAARPYAAYLIWSSLTAGTKLQWIAVVEFLEGELCDHDVDSTERP